MRSRGAWSEGEDDAGGRWSAVGAGREDAMHRCSRSACRQRAPHLRWSARARLARAARQFSGSVAMRWRCPGDARRDRRLRARRAVPRSIGILAEGTAVETHLANRDRFGPSSSGLGTRPRAGVIHSPTSCHGRASGPQLDDALQHPGSRRYHVADQSGHFRSRWMSEKRPEFNDLLLTAAKWRTNKRNFSYEPANGS